MVLLGLRWGGDRQLRRLWGWLRAFLGLRKLLWLLLLHLLLSLLLLLLCLLLLLLLNLLLYLLLLLERRRHGLSALLFLLHELHLRMSWRRMCELVLRRRWGLWLGRHVLRGLGVVEWRVWHVGVVVLWRRCL
jgi:hypothetical protein